MGPRAKATLDRYNPGWRPGAAADWLLPVEGAHDPYGVRAIIAAEMEADPADTPGVLLRGE